MKYSMNYPLYYKLKQTILQWIEDEKYRSGDLIPSEKQLQEMFNLSRTTVRLAMKELELEGLVVRNPGKGTFVASLKMETSPRRLLSFTEEMISYGLKPGSQVISLQKELPAGKIAKALQIQEDEEVWKLERIRLADSTPIATETSYLPAALINDIDINSLKVGSLYQQLLMENNIRITVAKERVEARMANTREIKNLNIAKGSPVLFVERLTFGYTQKLPMAQIPVELVRTTYNAERYVINYVIEKN